jgi:hypothetical protein
VFIGIVLGGSGTRAALVAADGSVLAGGRGPSGLLHPPPVCGAVLLAMAPIERGSTPKSSSA